MPVVIRSLLQDHANTSLLLEALERQIDAFAAGEAVDMGLLQSCLEYFASFPDACHHPKEDLILERLRRRAPDKAKELSRLEEEHRELAEATATLTRLVDSIVREEELPRDTLVGAGRGYVDNYRRHMAMEEQALFQVAAEILTPEDWLEVGEAIYLRTDPVFGDRYDAAFAALRADIDAMAGHSRGP